VLVDDGDALQVVPDDSQTPRKFRCLSSAPTTRVSPVRLSGMNGEGSLDLPAVSKPKPWATRLRTANRAATKPGCRR
jgi:hypothetical protein